ncbi:MAG: TAXI family TRAP transporter solute-binding subunit [Myxococcota bacterium]|nr:TAXI family TRAP transporter solute-binding subunit [Myxococcota bacterium]
MSPRRRLRDHPLSSLGVRVSGASLLVFVVVATVAWSLLPPPLPRTIRLGTGPAGGHYALFGEGLRREVAEHRIALELVPSAGSKDNIRRLLAGEIDVGLVQSGNLSDEEAARLESIAAVFLELVLVVSRAEWGTKHIAGGRIAIGGPGSGSNQLARDLLADQGVAEGEPPGTRLVEIGGEQGVDALLAGEVDSGVFVSTADVPWVRTLFADPRVVVSDLRLAEAFTRHYRYLKRVVVPAGLIDLREEIPPDNVELIATTASLVIRPGAHRALIPLLIESAREQLLQGGLFARPGEFPTAFGVEAPLAEEAIQYFERGPSFFYRWLPFRYAFAATRLAILVIPLLTLLYPLLRSAGPAYRWVIERRVYRWYRVLRNVERRVDAGESAESLAQTRKELERIGDDIRRTKVPTRYGARLFALRAHHRILVDRVEALEKKSQGA